MSERAPFFFAVTPAKAGVHLLQTGAEFVDSRFSGNDHNG
jgi:hypothetical protein